MDRGNEEEVEIQHREFVHPLLRLFMQSLLEIPLDNEEDILDRSFQEQRSKSTPCSIDFINKLEELDITEENIKDNLACAICQDKFKIGEKIISVPCKPMPHYFHIQNENCGGIIPWLETNNTCPICRTEFPKEEIEEDLEYTDINSNSINASNINEDNINIHNFFNTYLNIPVNIPLVPIVNTIHIDQDGFINEDIEEAIRRSLE
jgi:hypothetical protein